MRNHRERGSMMLTFALLIPVVLLLVALAVEVGRYETTVMQLENATDAAALAGLGQLAELVIKADTDIAADPSLIYSYANAAVKKQFETMGYYLPYDNNSIHFDGQTIYLTSSTTDEMAFHSYIPGLDGMLGGAAIQATSLATIDYDNGNLVYRTTDEERIIDRAPWAIHHAELHDLADAGGNDYVELAALSGGEFTVGQEYILKCGSYSEGTDNIDMDQWHTTDLDHDGWYDDDRNFDGFHDDDVNQEEDNGEYVISGTCDKTYPWEDPRSYTVSDQIYIPMDKGNQTLEGAGDGYAKAYGVVLHAVQNGDEAYWFMGLDGGAFSVPNTAANRALCAAAGVKYDTIAAGRGRSAVVQADGTCTSVVNAATSDFTYDSTIRLMNAPKVLVYSSDISDPVTQVLERAGIMRYTDWDFIDADGGYPRTVDINADGTSVTYNSLAEVLEGHDWVHLHHEDFTSSTQGKNNAVAIGNFVTGGGYMYCQCLAAETLDQALEQMGLTTMAFTNPIAGRTLTQSGYWDTLDSELTTDIDFYLQDASGAPLYYFPLDQNYYGFGFSPTGAVDLNDSVQGFSGAFKTMNPEFIDETKNLTITGWYDPAVAETSIWNEAGWQSANLILYESKLSVKLNADGDKNDNMTIETLYNNRVAYGWDGYIERQAVETWEDTHTEVQTTTTVIGHVCSYKKKVGGKWTYCANKSCCNNAAHAAYWTSNVYQTQTVTVPGQWVVDYYQYRLDLNKDGDYTDAQNNAETYVRELCGLHGDGFFTYTTGHEPSDLAMDRLILNNLLLSGAAGRMNYFGAVDLDGTDPEKGAVFYRNNAWFGFFDSQNDEHRFLDKGDILLAEPGNMCGTTNKAVMYRYKTDLDKDLAYYEHQQGSGRVVLVPIVECVSASYTSMYAMDSKTSDDDRRLRVIGSAYFFLRDVVHEAALRSDLGPVKPGQVRGIFIGYALKPS